MSTSDNLGRNRAKFRKVYSYGMDRRPDVRSFVDSLSQTTRSFDFQKILRDRSYYLISGEAVLTFPTASLMTEFVEAIYNTTGAVESISVTFPTPFSARPIVAFRLYPEWVLTSGSNVGYWASNVSTTGFVANFSAPYEGKLVYRAVYTQESYPVYVERTPGTFVWIAGNEPQYVDNSSISMSYATMPSLPTEIFSHPIVFDSSSLIDVGQAFADVQLSYTTNELSAPYTGYFSVIAMSTVPPGTPQPVDPP